MALSFILPHFFLSGGETSFYEKVSTAIYCIMCQYTDDLYLYLAGVLCKVKGSSRLINGDNFVTRGSLNHEF